MRHPARVVPMVFLGAVLVGTALLLLPIARQGDAEAPVVTALFTATSAVCITGLAVVDTAGYWSWFGEGVIASLIQLGGFGIMTMASLLGLVVAGRLGLRERLVAQAENKTLGLGDVRQVMIRVAVMSISVELILAIILFARFRFAYDYEFGEAVWHGVFHSVSAFNNAGFALYPDSLEGFVTDPIVMLPIALAVIIGGIGSPVILELSRRMRHPSRWSVHTKLTILGTAILLPLGFVAYLVFEWNNPATMGPLGFGDKLSAAFFSSVMPRSAGYNAIPMGEVQPETQMITMALMFIGGGSASTAGGIKVTTFILLAFVIWAEIRGEPDVSVFGRTIPHAVQRQALTIALLGVAAVASGTVVLELTTEFPMNDVMFETVSAFGPVGLSTGITPDLPPVSQLVLVVLMFTGRVGTVAVGTALALRSRRRRFSYPEDRPIVG
ncbi:potassium uptake TrkH family protein [Stackebrandtia albiflava]|uniref:Potassium uptake TrkH family protein n=2 Tax=Stackebrandtia albiflava TaxID=406432 RepID=A0A562V409_9ACTN|nr:potassium uptake TrkH family protein [Stackebrandtia albiflava]